MKSFFRYAFSDPAREPLTEEELHLIARVAEAVVKRGLSAPFLLFLESCRPLNFVASQTLYALMPGVGQVFDPNMVARVGRLLEKRECVDRLIERISEEEERQKK